jgi:hypothetical protein
MKLKPKNAMPAMLCQNARIRLPRALKDTAQEGCSHIKILPSLATSYSSKQKLVEYAGTGGIESRRNRKIERNFSGK